MAQRKKCLYFEGGQIHAHVQITNIVLYCLFFWMSLILWVKSKLAERL